MAFCGWIGIPLVSTLRWSNAVSRILRRFRHTPTPGANYRLQLLLYWGSQNNCVWICILGLEYLMHILWLVAKACEQARYVSYQNAIRDWNIWINFTRRNTVFAEQDILLVLSYNLEAYRLRHFYARLIDTLRAATRRPDRKLPWEHWHTGWRCHRIYGENRPADPLISSASWFLGRFRGQASNHCLCQIKPPSFSREANSFICEPVRVIYKCGSFPLSIRPHRDSMSIYLTCGKACLDSMLCANFRQFSTNLPTVYHPT